MGIQKPIDIAITDLKKDIIQKMNEANLPMLVLNLVINEISNSIKEGVPSYMQSLNESYQNQIQAEELKANPLVSFEEGVSVDGN